MAIVHEHSSIVQDVEVIDLTAEVPGPSTSTPVVPTPAPVAIPEQNASSSNNEASSPIIAEKVVFPPPCSWYKSSIAASRDDMWAYCSAGVIVLVYPPISYPSKPEELVIPPEAKKNSEEQQQKEGGGITQIHGAKVATDTNKRWPRFDLIGPQLEKYNAISFCQSSWDYLPVAGAPLVSGCDKGIVRIWNLDNKSTIIFQDSHAGNPIMGLDWSPCDHSVIYAIDDKGSMSVWDVVRNTLRTMNFGKIVPTCLNASPHEKDVVCFGTKGGNVLIVDVTGNSGKILAKVRHDEDVVSTAWMPKGEFDLVKYFNAATKTKLPLLASSIHSMKIPSIRIWDKMGADIGRLQAWEKDGRARPFKMFGSAAWARDPNSGKLLMISTGRKGEVFAWSNDIVHQLLHSAHTHNAIFAIIQCGDILWSLAYEPVIVGYNLRTMEVECIIPTFKGICVLSPSPVDSSRLAIGGTDSVIRILKCVAGYPIEGDSCNTTPMLTHRLKGKVTAMAWHPTRDNFIGFGTDEGVLGVYELKENNRFATQFERRVNGTVYTVMFGPSVYTEGYVRPSRGTAEPANGAGASYDDDGAPPAEDDGSPESKGKEKDQLMLYACGGNTVYMISPSRPTNSLINVSRIIEASNKNNKSSSLCTDKATEVRWAPDFSLLAVGYHDGRIELYAPPNLKLVCWIKCHLRAVQFLTWRPFDFKSGQESGTRWLASASNDGTTRLYNLAALYNEMTANASDPVVEKEPLMLISSEATLQGHGVRVISCAWSPFNKNLIVTVAYDCTAIIWNIEDGSHVARYMDHLQRLVACCFHPTDPFKVISVSDEQSCDFSVHIWDYRAHPFRRSAPKKVLGCRPVQAVKATNETIRATEELQQVVPMNDQKNAIQHVGAPGKAVASGSTKKTKPKSLLPLTSNSLINSKCSITEELTYLTDKKPVKGGNVAQAGQDPEHPSVYLGVLGSAKDCVDMLKVERQGHDAKKQFDHSVVLSGWMGDSKWIEQAIKNRQVTESMIIMAAPFSHKLQFEAMNAFAEQLVDNEEYVRASMYFLLVDKVDAAVKALVDHALFREAVSMLKATHPNDKERLNEVLAKWAYRAINDGNYELATKIYYSSGEYSNALSVIEKRALPYAFHAGCYISSKVGDDKKLEMFGAKFVLDGITSGAYKECFNLINDYPTLKWLTSIVKVHECLTGFCKYATSIKTEKDFDMWRMILANSIDEIREYMGQVEGKDLDLDTTKICTNILVSIPQNEADVHQIITKNLSLMMIGIHDNQSAVAKAIEIIKLADTWFAKKHIPLYFSLVMMTEFVVTEFKYSSVDELPENITSAKSNAILLLRNSLNLIDDEIATNGEENGHPPDGEAATQANGDLTVTENESAATTTA